MVTRQQKLNRQQTRTELGVLVIVVIALFIVPQLAPPYDVMLIGFGSAAVLTILLCMNPTSLRSRGGSLVTGWILVAALWLLAVVGAVVSLFG